MADKQDVVVGEVDWKRMLSVGHILRGFRIALWPPSKLLLCLAALAVTLGAGMLLDLAFQTEVSGQSFSENMEDVFRVATGQGTSPEPTLGNVTSGWGFYYGPFDALRGMCQLITEYWQAAPWFALLNTLIAVLVWTFFGGAVCRMAALQFARDERPTLGEALRFACKRYGSLVASPLALFVVIALMALPTFFVASLVLLVPFVGELIVGGLMFITIGIGVVLTFLFLFGASSLGLQMPAIGAEGRDAFDAISRGVNYVFTRPWKYIFYTAFSMLYMCLTFVLVRLFAFLVLKLPYAFITMWPWVGKEAEDGTPGKLARVWVEPQMTNLFEFPAGAEGTQYIAAIVISVFIFILLGMMIAFIPSFLLTSQTIIYFLLRRQIDFKDLDEVYVEPGTDEGELVGEIEISEEPVVEAEPPAANGAQEDDEAT